MSEQDIHSRERLARLETNVEHIDHNLQQVIKNTQVQHDTLLKLTDAVQQISHTLSEYKNLEKKVEIFEAKVDQASLNKERLDKLDKQALIIKVAFIGILLGILLTMVPPSSYPTFILKLLGVPV